jgi:hypothetical protein
MAGKSDYASMKVLDKLLRNVDFTVPGIWVALFTALPSDGGSGGAEVSVVGTAYARKPCTFNSATNPSTGLARSISAVDLIYARATAQWGNLVGFGLYDALNGGNPIYLDVFQTPKFIDVGDQFMIPVGTLICEEQ